jgi:PncC family amidohydrolase
MKGMNMIRDLHNILIEKNLTISTAESCTGGLLAGRLTQFGGSSAYFMGSIVSYSNSAKVALLDVTVETLQSYGAVSEQTATEMLIGCAKKFNTDMVCATTGIAGPDGGSEDKPVGTVYIGVKLHERMIVEEFVFKGDRVVVREQTVDTAIDMMISLIGMYKI